VFLTAFLKAVSKKRSVEIWKLVKLHTRIKIEKGKIRFRESIAVLSKQPFQTRRCSAFPIEPRCQKADWMERHVPRRIGWNVTFQGGLDGTLRSKVKEGKIF